jgi:hypothetical protein
MASPSKLRAQIKSAPRFREMLKSYRENEQIKIGKPPTNPKMAWWALPVKTRELLDQKRDEGLFGGKPGKAPYWIVQEAGAPEVGISPIKYLRAAVDAWAAKLDVEVKDWIAPKPFGKYGQ